MTDAYPKEANIFEGLADEGWVPLRLMRATKPDAIAALKAQVPAYGQPLVVPESDTSARGGSRGGSGGGGSCREVELLQVRSLGDPQFGQ